MVGIYIPTKMKVILFHFLNTYSNLILMGWLIIFLIKSIQLGNAFQKIHQIRRQEIQFPDIYWIKRFDTLLKTPAPPDLILMLLGLIPSYITQAPVLRRR